jgi:benzoyl-CoA reductase/2-hydroxyglutaryl-CoA dehydratase subunit BcrC/BadD/HgdB
MIKSYWEMVKTSAEAENAKGPRAWLMYLIQLSSAMLKAYDDDAKVVWVTSPTFPMELLAAFDVAAFDALFACNIPAGADPKGCADIMAGAESKGYSIDICSAHRLSLGCYFKSYLPRADLLLTTSHFCDVNPKTNQLFGQYHDKEAIMLDVPNEISRDSVMYVSGQLSSIARKLEEVSGQKLDIDRLRECVRASNRARAAYGRLCEMGKVRPFPWSGFRAFMLSLLGNTFSGMAFQEQLYQKLVDECQQRISEGKVLPEKYRVLWLAWVPIQPTNIEEIFRANEVSIVTSELARVYWDEIDERHPFEGMALHCLKSPFVGRIEQRLAGVLHLAEEYDIDGAIHFSHIGCRHANAPSRLLADALAKKGVPFLVLDSDVSDMRAYSAERTRLALESFIELMASNRKITDYAI